MRKVIRFTVLGSPVAQPRQRHRHVRTKAGAEFNMNYTEAKHPVQQFKADIKAEAKAAGLPPALLEGPIVLECRFYLARPARLMRKRDPEGPVPHTSRPDLDNLYKSVQDALKGVLWKDDSQIVGYGLDHGKAYHEKDGRPRLELTLYSVDTGD
ncbi:MAG TPA: RusA family crossover junction endodeoxyribonuclease [Symbiobacteriaceae bacterium]|nr:RusA family crossover junction endodeoxyribonuclease [Symbiobacteriaceae bacterium]